MSREHEVRPAAEVGDVPEGGHPADYRTPGRTQALHATKAVGRGIGKATVAGAKATAATSRFAAAKFRAFTHSGGAGQTGLARMTELHASHTAGDAAMMLALAGIFFFNPQTAEARSQVAVFLLLTMIPFTLVAPFVGPLLDRFSHGRRWAIGTTMATRAFLCWVLAEAVYNKSDWLFPAALGVLIASKAYNIARAAAVPRLLPPGTSLVRANSMVSIAGGIVKPTTGFASYGGLHMWQGDGDPRHAVAFVLQVYGLVPILSARENVAIALRARGVSPSEADERADEELTRFHIGDLGERQVEELSGGQMQRVACARAFAVSPEILLADEPTSELDEGNREHVMDQLRAEAGRGAIVVVATHDPAVVGAADRKIVLDEGRVVPAEDSAYAGGR